MSQLSYSSCCSGTSSVVAQQLASSSSGLSSSTVTAAIAEQQWCSDTAAMHAQVMHAYCSGATAVVSGAAAAVAILWLKGGQWVRMQGCPSTPLTKGRNAAGKGV